MPDTHPPAETPIKLRPIVGRTILLVVAAVAALAASWLASYDHFLLDPIEHTTRIRVFVAAVAMVAFAVATPLVIAISTRPYRHRFGLAVQTGAGVVLLLALASADHVWSTYQYGLGCGPYPGC